MLVLSILPLFALLQGCTSECVTCGQNKAENRVHKIVGGVDADKGEIGWQVALTSGEPSSNRRVSVFCGGTLINDEWVMTAAHCTRGTSATSIWIVIGMLDRSVPDYDVAIQVAEKVEHPTYNTDTLEYDFSLLRLKTVLDFTSLTVFPNQDVFPACWPTQDEVPGDWAIISGWGTTQSGGSQPNVLQEANVTIVSRDDCNVAGSYNDKITEQMICAGVPDVGGKDACQGDSGGPIVALVDGSFEIIGATSWGYGCADARYPGVYSDVFYVLGWVKSTTGSEDGCPRDSAPTTAAPTEAPTAAPTEAPTNAPTAAPTSAPTAAPTAAPTEAPTTGPPVVGGCSTVGGDDPDKECVFPFIFGRVTYDECTYEVSSRPWCSTATDSDDQHIGGQGNWGYCSSECPAEDAPCEDTYSEWFCDFVCYSKRRCKTRRACLDSCRLTCQTNYGTEC